MDKIIGTLRKSVDKAIQSAAQPLGVYPVKVDVQLRAYRNMTPRDFDLLSREYGLPQTLNYIDRMERLRTTHG